MERKVFCIGFQKTGTTSLGVALRTLGYNVGGYYDFRDLAADRGTTLDQLRERALRLAEQYDAVQDSPWPLFYRELDEAFPGSQFILVTRDPDSWILSAKADFGSTFGQIRRLTYGYGFPDGHEAEWVARFNRHNAEATAYFEGRNEDFIRLSLSDGEVNWQSICGFLGHEVPNEPWPRANTRSKKRTKLLYWRILKRLGFAS